MNLKKIWLKSMEYVIIDRNGKVTLRKIDYLGIEFRRGRGDSCHLV